MIVILHNPHDAHSRNFVQTHGADRKIISWSQENEAEISAYFADGNPHPSAFPSVVNTETKKIVRRPLDWREVEIQFLALEKTDVEKEYEAAILAGFPAPGKDYGLALGDEDRSKFSQLITLIREGLDLGHLKNHDEIQITDREGNLKTMSIGDFRETMFWYGMHYKGLWEKLKKNKIHGRKV